MNYKTVNNITGWLVFAIATYVYVSTIEPTASFWDCGEFIATAYKMEVGHPPGAPFFMLLGRMFSMFVAPDQAAMMINTLSALCSSFTILFLFWTITALAKKIVNHSPGDMGRLLSPLPSEGVGGRLAIMGSGTIGGLAYTFSDSFWFSAVEGEVYAMSSLFTAVVFWAILKWEAVADEKHSNRWLILICYLMGLSIGVHLLNLLAIPAITFVYYFKKYKVTRKGVIIASLIAIVVLGAIQGLIIPMTVKLAAKFELMFVNGFGLPFNSGIFTFILLIIGLIVWGIRYTTKKGKVVANTVMLGVTVIMIGYGTFGIILIRSAANPPMDENNPENAFTLLSYLNREQYGDRPLLYGHFFDSPLDSEQPYIDGDPVYFQDKVKGKYIISDDKKQSIPNYAKEFNMFLPRMYSSDSRHVTAYKEWSGFKGRPVRYRTMSGEYKTINKPTFTENMQFFLSHQIGWMYLRYFLWNFAGRQNDEQGHGSMMEGNWLSGINYFDNMRLGPQENLPESLGKNPARNCFYFLPLLLGLLGLIFHLKKDRKDFIVVALLFFFTGVAITIYLNQYPYQPRERDYAYSASFYAFAIWIGLGVLALYNFFRKKIPQVASASIATVLCLPVPAVMAKDGWDDHDRSNTYTARDFAMNYLDSCEPNGILYTNGDNDTFPLWYVQEVEEYRTDVRVCNLSLLNTDWYIDQMKRKAYDSDPVPYKLGSEKYRQGTRDYVPIIKKIDASVDVKKAMDFISDDNNQLSFGADRKMNYFPSHKFSMKVDRDKVIQNKTVQSKDTALIIPELQWELDRSYVLKNDMMILDLLANNNWDRPVYFAITTGNDSYIGLEEYFQLEGLAYRLVPVKSGNSDGQTGRINTDIMYHNLMNKFKWGGMDKAKIYMNENNRRMCMNVRNNFARLAEALISEGKKDSAVVVLDKCLEVMPENNVPFNFFMLPVAEAYYKADTAEKANKIVARLFDVYEQELKYYFSLPAHLYSTIENTVQQSMSVLYRLNMLTNRSYPQGDFGKGIETRFTAMQEVFAQKQGRSPSPTLP